MGIKGSRTTVYRIFSPSEDRAKVCQMVSDPADLLRRVQAKYRASPNRMLEMVNGFQGNTDTRNVAEWSFDPGTMHLFGLRREPFSGKFDDVFVFLIKGLVFKFQGSTEPGSSHTTSTLVWQMRSTSAPACAMRSCSRPLTDAPRGGAGRDRSGRDCAPPRRALRAGTRTRRRRRGASGPP